ncbi:MAG: preprotein translocase subunit SecE [Burkholderiales bacterium]|jgi:preprotein translocase subunit SecE|nr:preprotein translocase subunit SecE [Burkholderiales bacterium]
MNTPVKSDEIKQPSNVFNYVAFLLLALGLGLFYGLEMNVWLKWGIFILSLAAALGTFFFVAPMGINLHGYVRDSYREMQKVVWPARKETMQFTWIVFLFVIILGLFLWLVDSSLAWLLYGVILGKGS